MYARIRLQPTSSTRIHDALSVRRMPFLLSSRFYIAKEGKMSAYALRRRAPQARCPKCNSPFPTTLPTCNKCSYISDVPSSLQADYFSLFGLPSLVASGSGSSNEEDMNVDARNVFSVDPRELRNRFLQMQKLSHPDRWSQKGPVRLYFPFFLFVGLPSSSFFSVLTPLSSDAYFTRKPPWWRLVNRHC